MEFTLHAARHPDVAQALAVHENRLTEGLADVVTTALAGAGRRPGLDPEDLARLLVAAFEGLTARRLVHGDGEPGRPRRAPGAPVRGRRAGRGVRSTCSSSLRSGPLP
ncbi:TetR family transcriptional regulator C-terminal domain-containing protein [Streptomyces similanensis]|uniref:TetR family transcriptional regulator C-terminal domain-containing protein n=1 Tax=Streptomyces similanensis TaxID=1274988 RepID=UPI0031EF9953